MVEEEEEEEEEDGGDRKEDTLSVVAGGVSVNRGEWGGLEVVEEENEKEELYGRMIKK